MNCKIVGYDFKCLQVELNFNESFYCERGSVIYHQSGIIKEINVLGKGIGGILKRKLSGESVFFVKLTNTGRMSQKLLLAGRSSLLPINMAEFSNQIICRGGYYVASTEDIDIDFSFNFSSLFSGLGFIMQKLKGGGTVFLDSFGSPLKIEVIQGDSIFVDEKSLICLDLTSASRMQASFSGSGFLGGEGFTMLQIFGPAIVYVNSINQF